MIRSLFPVLITGVFISCAVPTEDETNYSAINSSLPDLNWQDGIEIVTWNIENFPKAGQQTIDSVAIILKNLNADIYCLQEISSESEFTQLAERLDGYNIVYSTVTEYLNLAILYRSGSITLRNQTNLFSDYSYEFASRPPLRTEMTFLGDKSIDFTLINLHLKCCNNGFNRRVASAELLHSFLLESSAAGVVNQIVVGDWNDDISDNPSVNSFTIFLNDTLNFSFMTWDLANAESDVFDSYPGYPSFIDHILISSDLFDEAGSGDVQTMRLGDYISNYDELISDHRPVVWRFKP